MKRAIRVEQQAPFSHGWDLFSQKQVLCGRTAATGKTLADIIFSSIVLAPAKDVTSPQNHGLSPAVPSPFSPAGGGRARRRGGTAGGDGREGPGSARLRHPRPALPVPVRGRPCTEGCCGLLTDCAVSLGGCLLFSCHLTSDSC